MLRHFNWNPSNPVPSQNISEYVILINNLRFDKT